MTRTQRISKLIGAAFFAALFFSACQQPATITHSPTATSTQQEVVVKKETSDATATDTKDMLAQLSDKNGTAATTEADNSGASDTENDLQGNSASHKKRHRHHKKHYDTNSESFPTNNNNTSSPQEREIHIGASSSTPVPTKVYTVLNYVLKNKQAPDGYVGGRVFTNVEKVLPVADATGRRINYQEWDVNAHLQGVNRGTERLCTGDDNRYWFTNDHYKTFTQVFPK